MEEKQIAKEIVLKMLEHNAFIRSEYPEAKTVADMVVEAYKTILTAVKEN